MVTSATTAAMMAAATSSSMALTPSVVFATAVMHLAMFMPLMALTAIEIGAAVVVILIVIVSISAAAASRKYER